MKIKSTLLLVALSALGLNNNAGAQWVEANAGLTVNDANSFATLGNKIFAGTGNISGNGAGVFVSGDHGATWTAANTGLNTMDVRKIIAHGTDLFAALAGTGTNGGIYMSSDNGATWTAKNTGLAIPYSSRIVAFESSLYAVMADGMYVSTDNAANWTKATDAVFVKTNLKAMLKSGTNLLIASDNGGKQGVFISTDNGTTWNATSITGEADDLAMIGNTVFAATKNGVFKSSDNGVTWTATTNTSGVVDNATALAVVGTKLIVGAPYSVYSTSDNGTTWTDISQGAGGANLSVEAFGMDGTNLYLANTFHSVGVWKRPLTELGGATGIQDLNTKGTVAVYPNPASGGVFQVSFSDAKNASLQVYNTVGVLVHQVSVANSGTYTLDLSQLPAGMYSLKVTGMNSTAIEKLVIR